MGCSEFLTSYSDYRDGLISDPRLLRRLRRHLAACPSCRRYDECLRTGVQALREDREIDPSPGFEARLRARVAAAADHPPEPLAPEAAGIAAALMLGAAVALLIYQGSRREHARTAATAVTASYPERPLPLVVANPGVPFVTFTDLSVTPFRTGSGINPIPVQSDIPLGTWANLPR